MDFLRLHEYLQSIEEPSNVAGALELKEKLDQFNTNNERSFDFTNCSADDLENVVTLLFRIVSSIFTAKNNITSTHQCIIEASLRCLKILSRSKECAMAIGKIQNNTFLILSLACARQQNVDLSQPVYALNTVGKEVGEKIKLEALKIICNCVFHSDIVRQVFIEQESSKYITDNLESYIEHSYNEEIVLVQQKILFLISALNLQERTNMNMKYKTADILIRNLEETLRKKGVLVCAEDLSATASPGESCCIFSQNEILIISEALKTLFNLSVDLCEDSMKEGIDFGVWNKLSVLLHCLLSQCIPLPERPEDLAQHVAHMLVNIPKSCLNGLIPPVKRRQWLDAIPKREGYPVEFELRDMSAIITLITDLDETLQNGAKSDQSLSKVFSILASLCHVCRYLCMVRKYLRFQILPHRKDVTVKPEESRNLKGRLVKLMTHVDTNIKSMAADFLFVLCKENPDRLVKHTGYGNAAGILASRGLMGGKRKAVTGDYSSDDEDSETEEFHAVADHIDIMTGAMSKDKGKENPLSNMTDEEKEKNAEELMNLIGKLSSLDVIKPMRIGADGHPTEMGVDETKMLLREKINKS